MTDIETLTTRQLQTEAARALSVLKPTNNELSVFNKQAHHDSHAFYRAVIRAYVEEHGDIPSLAGPGRDVKLMFG